MAHPAMAASMGRASYYRDHRHAGFFAAHRSLPFGTHLFVTNLANGRSVTVVIVDRGPFTPDRLIDVSVAAAEALGFRAAGVAQVRIEAIDR